MLAGRSLSHVSYRPLRETRGEPELEALCGRLVPRLPTVIDNAQPSCPICAGLLVRFILAGFPRGLLVPDPPASFPVEVHAGILVLHDAET